MEKLTLERLLALEIGEELEQHPNIMKYIRVPGGWIVAYHSASYEKILNTFVPEPPQELTECVSGELVKFNFEPIYVEKTFPTMARTEEERQNHLDIQEDYGLTKQKADAFECLRNYFLSALQMNSFSSCDNHENVVHDAFKYAYNYAGLEPNIDDAVVFKIDKSGL